MQFIKLLLLVLLTKGIMVNAQTITILSAYTNEPLPFATIQNLRAQWAVVSSDKGTFSFSEINSRTGDSMLITYTGYNPIRMVKPFEDKLLKLEPLAVMLQPVVVLPCRGNKKEELRNFKQNKTQVSFTSNEEALGSYAAYLPNNQNLNGIISTIQFSLQTTFTSKIAARAPFKVRLLNYDDISQLPGIPLLLKELVVYPKRNEVVVDISDEWIRLPPKGIVVVVDFFFADEKYIYSQKLTHTRSDGQKVDSLYHFYGSNIKFTLGENLLGKGYSYQYNKNSWKELVFSKGGNVAPQIKLSLKLCD
jgi:hypothetical protein